ncbi:MULTISPECIES: winged helix-turn-helix transcriptional regulator [Alicyclobacillus]|uniref:Helix-turn-helix transcriptional regulator n=1 Tax=Alicyclobacillus acidoterrestris (strain ATCC 49025 / DSM 3922 / CIP 106132 / NCIMB 13137 / GD3B) TaxID=1356854 RepID=T0DTZ3_ALIAG|nr:MULTISPECIES: helix-turn-helix domain-containing protein [Alicyclobacillus]EPZ52931.1 hypothetical protein N007_02175 [Alicyclobacillus acidoterrestris ATCC 49025]UNO49141.1 helix-turn-helix transcriptional regulator [Alicyclobacillus acidoterrestris]GEO26590.1 transcriptional regulator [Alicyclobacillus acidoterrestris]
MKKLLSEQHPDLESIPCSIETALNIIGGKWSFLVLKELYSGTKRYSELQRALPKVSPKALSNTLRHLESNGVVERTVYPTVPVTVEYSLTEKGIDFHSVLVAMKHWGAKWT